MATLDEISEERQKLSERLARLDADRAKVAQQVEELEIAERVLSRFGMAQPAGAAQTRTAHRTRACSCRASVACRREAGKYAFIERSNDQSRRARLAAVRPQPRS